MRNIDGYDIVHSSTSAYHALEPDEMTIAELRALNVPDEIKVRTVQAQLGALGSSCCYEQVYRDEFDNITDTERARWTRFYCELLGETTPI